MREPEHAVPVVEVLDADKPALLTSHPDAVAKDTVGAFTPAHRHDIWVLMCPDHHEPRGRVTCQDALHLVEGPADQAGLFALFAGRLHIEVEGVRNALDWQPSDLKVAVRYEAWGGVLLRCRRSRQNSTWDLA
jgi:hypothetical protein